MKIKIPNEQTFTEIEIKFPLSFKLMNEFYHYEKEGLSGVLVCSSIGAILKANPMSIEHLHGKYELCTKQEVQTEFEKAINFQRNKFGDTTQKEIQNISIVDPYEEKKSDNDIVAKNEFKGYF